MTLNDFLKQLSENTAINIMILRGMIFIAIILIGIILRLVFVKFIIRILLKLTKKTKTDLDGMLVHAFEKPGRYLITGFSFWVALNAFNLPKMIRTFLSLSVKIFFILMVFWFLYRAADSVIYILERFLNRTDKKVSPSLIGLLSKLLKFLIVLLEIFSVIDLLGYDVSGIVAGFGLGGLAISLAAKDAAANLLGSITIMLDKTYSVGEWISTKDIEGTVEEIGFRSTKVRTFSDALVSIPNSIMSNDPVTNWSKMGKRKVSYMLQIPLDTPPEKIKTLLDKIKEMLVNHGDINQDLVVVNMKGFGSASLEVLIHFFTKTTSWVTYLQVSEDVNLKVLRIFKEVGISITIPANRLLVENIQSDAPNQDLSNEKDETY